MLTELSRPEHAEVAGQLAEGTSDSETSRRLLVRQAELTTDADNAADICLLVCRDQLPEGVTLDWVAQGPNRAERYEQTIAMAERELRAGKVISVNALEELGHTYQSIGNKKQESGRACRGTGHALERTAGASAQFSSASPLFGWDFLSCAIIRAEKGLSKHALFVCLLAPPTFLRRPQLPKYYPRKKCSRSRGLSFNSLVLLGGVC